MDEKMNVNPDDITELDLMKEFMKLTDVPLQPNELTVRMFMEHMNVDRNKARHTLYKYENLGILKSRKVIMSGTQVNAYSPKNGTWEDVVKKMKE